MGREIRIENSLINIQVVDPDIFKIFKRIFSHGQKHCRTASQRSPRQGLTRARYLRLNI